MSLLLNRLASLRLLVPLGTVVAAMAVVMLDSTLGWQEWRAQTLEAGERQARAAGAALLRHAERSFVTQPALLAEELAFVAAAPEVVAVALFDDTGQCVHAHNPAWIGRHLHELLPPAEAALGDAARGQRTARVLLNETPRPAITYAGGFRLPAQPGELRGLRQGLIYLRLEPLLPGFLPTLQSSSLPVALLTALIAVLASGYLQSRVVTPLRRLAEASGTLAQGGCPDLPDVPAAVEVRDVTIAFTRMAERIRAQFAELRGRREFELAVLNTLQEGLVVADVEGRILFANAAALALFGGRCDPVQAGHLDRLFSHDERATLVAGADALTCQLQNDCGASFWAELQAWPLVSLEGPVLVLVIRDVTESRQVAIELAAHRDHLGGLVESRTRELAEARRQAEQANESKSAFLAVVSHEIRTPLNALIGLMELLGRSRLDAEQDGMLRVMQDAAATLHTLIADMLDFSRIEAGRLNLAAERLSVEAEVARVTEGLDALAAERRVELRLRIEGDLPAWVLGDAHRLRQILSNLLGNAIKFSSGLVEPGRVLLSVRCRSEEEGAAQLEFAVRDNGIGMRAEDQTRLFAPFEQADAETARRFGGTGLGLSIVRHLTEAMGGRVDVHSAPGLGSLFTVSLTLPLCFVEPTGGMPLAACRVVLVGPSHDDARTWTNWLERAGARVEQVQGIEDLGQRIDQEAPERIVWIVQTDGLGGFELDHLLDLRQRAGVAAPAMLLLDAASRAQPRLWTMDMPVLNPRLLTPAHLVQAVATAGIDGSDGNPGVLSPKATPSVAGPRVLVVDDSPTNRLVVERQIVALGYQVQTCEGALEALALLSREHFALILSDLCMPGVDGFEFVRRFRTVEAECRRSRVPVIALTANALDGERQRSLAAGMDDYLTKPVTLSQLAHTLTQWLTPEPMPSAPLVPTPDDEGQVLTALGSFLGEDPDVLRDYLEVFRAELGACPLVLAEALRETSFSRLAVLAHQLKSSARSIGELELARACEALERATARGTGAALETPVREINGQIHQTAARLERALLALGPAPARGRAKEGVAEAQHEEE